MAHLCSLPRREKTAPMCRKTTFTGRCCGPCVTLFWIGGTDVPQYRWKHTPDMPELQCKLIGDAGRPTSVPVGPPGGDWLAPSPAMPALCHKRPRALPRRKAELSNPPKCLLGVIGHRAKTALSETFKSHEVRR